MIKVSEFLFSHYLRDNRAIKFELKKNRTRINRDFVTLFSCKTLETGQRIQIYPKFRIKQV